MFDSSCCKMQFQSSLCCNLALLALLRIQHREKLILGGFQLMGVIGRWHHEIFTSFFYLLVTYVSQVLWTYRLWLWGCWLAGSSWRGWVSLWRLSHVSLWWCWPSPPSSASLCSGWAVQHRRFQRSIISRAASLGEFVCFILITVILLICITSYMRHVKFKVVSDKNNEMSYI